MPVLGKRVFGAKGQDTTLNPFAIDPVRSQIAENFVVRSNSRRTRQGYRRWKYDKYASNAIRFIGTYKKSHVIYKDFDNLRYNVIGNAFGGGGSGTATFEFRVRIHGTGGYSLLPTLHVMSRLIHGNGNTFALFLASQDVPILENYAPTLVISDTSGTTNIPFPNAKIRHGEWRTVTITINTGALTSSCFIDGVLKQTVVLAGTPRAAVSTFGTTRNDQTYSDIVVGAGADLVTYTPLDLTEIRIWDSVRSTPAIVANWFKELDVDDRAGLKFYTNFSELHDGDTLRDMVSGNEKVLGFTGGNMPYMDPATSNLMFDGSTMFGKLNPIGGPGISDSRNLFGCNTAAILKSSEIVFTALKVKQCRVAGPLEMYFDGVTSKYGLRLLWKKNGVNSILSMPGFIAAVDVNNTEFAVGVQLNVTGGTISMWLNGVKVASDVFATAAASSVIAENGRNIGCGPLFNADFAAIKVKWFRSFDYELEDAYYQTRYNQESSEFELNKYSHGVQTMDFAAAAQRNFVGTGTNLNAGFSPVAPTNNFSYIILKENKEQVGEEYQDVIVNLNVGAQTWQTAAADSTGDPWAAGHTKITNKEGFQVTTLVTRYNATSWRNIKVDKSTNVTEAFTTALVNGGFDRDHDPNYKLELYYFINLVTYFIAQQPSFIGGDLRMTTLKPCRYIGQFKSADGIIDAIITIVGTAICVFDRITKAMTQYPVSVLPNNDKPFVGDFLDNQLYITDGLTKIHVYAFNAELRVVKWGFVFPLTPIVPVVGTAAGPWTATLDWMYVYYNREIDQFGPTGYLPLTGFMPELNFVTRFMIQLDAITPSPDFYEGVSDIAIFRTKNLNSGQPGIRTDLYLYDFVRGNSQGAMDWSQNDNDLFQRFPTELVGVVETAVPNGDFVTGHAARLWVAEFDKIRFSRIGSELHTAIIKSETYLFPPDHFFIIPGNKQITGAASYNENTLAVFTLDTMDLIAGIDISDFERRRIYSGVGCVAHRTIKKIGNALIWLGLDDVYVYISGSPQPIDQEGKISAFIKSLGTTNLKNAFAVHNVLDQLYELNIPQGATWKSIVFDLKTGEYTINTDVNAVCGETIVHESDRPTVFHGLNGGFIVHQADDVTNYGPTGTLRTTVVSNVGQVLTVVDPLQTTEAGLIGNTVYVVNSVGRVQRLKVISNTTFTITYTPIDSIMGAPTAILAGETVFIAPIFWHMKTSVLFTGSPQNSLQASGGETSDPTAVELIGLGFVHIPIPNIISPPIMWFCLHREGSLAVDSPIQVSNLNQMYSLMKTINQARAQFMDVEIFYLSDLNPLDLIGLVYEMNISDSSYVS